MFDGEEEYTPPFCFGECEHIDIPAWILQEICRLTHKSAETGRYVSEEENGEDMCQTTVKISRTATGATQDTAAFLRRVQPRDRTYKQRSFFFDLNAGPGGMPDLLGSIRYA
jgi:hypothetical protein